MNTTPFVLKETISETVGQKGVDECVLLQLPVPSLLLLAGLHL